MEQRPEVAKNGVLWHAIDSTEALRLMESGNDGLRQKEVLVRREKYGLNRFRSNRRRACCEFCSTSSSIR